MALGALELLKTDYSLAVTGVLGPDGATERVPLGTVWMAVASKDTVRTKKFQFYGDRLRNKDLALSMAMLLIWRFINDRLN